MNGSRRVFIHVLPLLAVVTACGSVSTTSTSASAPSSAVGATTPSSTGPGAASTASAPLPIIHLGGASGGVEIASAASPTGQAVDSKMRVAQGSIVYSLSGDVPTIATTGPSWSMSPKHELEDARVTALAGAFGVTGAVVRLPVDQGGGWQVGAQDGTTANLTVVDDGPLSWYFNPVMTTSSPISTCSSAVVPDGAAAASTEVVDTCTTPAPPVGVPTKDEALGMATAILAAAGVDLTGQTLTATADEWSASVTGMLELGGHRTQMTTQLFFGGGGAVMAASGFLATPVAGADYPLVTTAEALQRLNDRDDAWMMPLGGAGIAVRDGAPEPAAVLPAEVGCAPMVDAVDAAGMGSSDSPATSPAPLETSAVVIAPVPSDALLCPQMPVGDDGSTVGSSAAAVSEPIVEAPATTVEPIVVTLTGVRLDIDPVYAADGTVWLLPTFVFTSDDGGEFSVVAVTDEYLHNDGA